MNHTLSIVAIFRNEHRFIVQWIEYHLKVGVDHFYLYDNGGDHWELLEPFKEFITYTLWTDDIANAYQTRHQNRTRQKGAYTHCVDHFKDDSEWIQLLDLDEFLVPISSINVKECINEGEDNNVGVLRIPRYNFGNAGNWKKPINANVIDYKRRERKASHFKDLGRMKKIEKILNPHLIRARGTVVESQNLYIHHHYTRSLSEWMNRARTGGGQAGKGFRWFIGQRPWLAFLTYSFLNIRSLYPISLTLVIAVSIWLFNLPAWMLMFIIPNVIWALFAWQRGQNEVFDNRLYVLLKK